jgi:membrane protease YdiL (CAAX protease family)
VPTAGVDESSVLRWARIFYLVLAVAGIVWLGVRRGRIGLELFVASGQWLADVGLGVVAGLALAGGWEMARKAVPGARRVEQRIGEILGPLDRSEALALAILSALAEEFFFRGAVQDAWGFLPALALFTVLHVGPGRDFRLWTLFAAVGGVLLGGLVVWRGALLAAIVAHAVVNAIGLTRLAMRRGDRQEA